LKPDRKVEGEKVEGEWGEWVRNKTQKDLLLHVVGAFMH
jgi:hypothetical protein